jgi:uncharacterized protein (TIGR01777 family)
MKVELGDQHGASCYRTPCFSGAGGSAYTAAVDAIARRSAMPAPLASLWTWHIRPGALERLTPPWDPVRVLARSGDLGEGTRVTLHVPVGLFKVAWIAEHRDVRPPHGFSDVQVHGPFAHWVHHHAMTEDGPAASILDERIEFAGRGGPLGRAMARRLVARRLPSLLRYRHETLAADLAAHARVATRPRLTVGITGASGLVGSALTHFLTTGGHRVIRFVRGQRTAEPRPPSDIDAVVDAPWDPARGFLQPDRLPRLDAVVHLAGAGVADRRWTPRRMALIRDSRVEGTATLARALAALDHPPEALLCASAIGFYGFDGMAPIDETAPMGGGFLAAVCGRWEAAAEPARAAGIRVAHLRLGLVLSPAGGVLKAALRPFKAGLGGVIGSGAQGMSWVGLDDVVSAFYQAMYDRRLAGPINVTAPEPVSNRDFTQALGRALHRPTVVPVPPAALRLLLGRQMADETALSSAWVRPARLEEAGYAFRHRTLAAALAHYLP